MSGLQLAWALSLLVTLTALPVGLVRMLAYRSGEVDHQPTLLVAALVGLGLGLAGLAALAVTSVMLVLA
jgi:hypothetical protein